MLNVRVSAAVMGLLGLLTSGASGGFLYLCGMDGLARSECCCPDERTPPAETSVRSEECCALLSAAPAELAAVPEHRIPTVVPVLLPRPPHEILVDRPWALSFSWLLDDEVAPRGPPLFLKHRSLLI